MIVADSSEYKNQFINFLSGQYFADANHTYAIYLLAPIVTTLVYGLTKNGTSYNPPESVSEFKEFDDLF